MRKKKGIPADRKTGASRMIQLGYKQVQVWLDAKELQAVQLAAGARPLAAWMRELACREAGIHFHYR